MVKGRIQFMADWMRGGAGMKTTHCMCLPCARVGYLGWVVINEGTEALGEVLAGDLVAHGLDG